MDYSFIENADPQYIETLYQQYLENPEQMDIVYADTVGVQMQRPLRHLGVAFEGGGGGFLIDQQGVGGCLDRQAGVMAAHRQADRRALRHRGLCAAEQRDHQPCF